MPAVEMESPEQYKKAWEVLIEVGGTFHGVGQEKRILLVTKAQYNALVAAGVVKSNSTEARHRGQKKAHRDGTAQRAAGDPEN
ncbi:MAG TPA: hypothetical protein VMG10_00200 [Gemmataceae bacterium]|nr:hypothetical protein [Gemmataceae bacterium]